MEANGGFGSDLSRSPDKATVGYSWHFPKLLPAASRRRLRKIQHRSQPRRPPPHPPAPRCPAGLPTVTSQSRRRRLRPDAECGAVVEVGALGGDAADDVLGW
jgi:hypothetical protein